MGAQSVNERRSAAGLFLIVPENKAAPVLIGRLRLGS